ncbi:MAG: class I mannose-6-phosphate isomerase [Myxococcota bacterium]|nr:class I mannose-6-phosphate isomerase [Myxococcota bacterium]
METLPILSFKPIFKETVWGGRRLEHRLGKALPQDVPVGESWEIVDLPSDQSVIATGDVVGKTLTALCADAFEPLLGGVALLEDRFPLLFKFIDAHQTLSVQVHPDEAACARLGRGARPKTEAWYIIDCEPNAVLYVGLKPGVSKAAFAKAIDDGTTEDLLHRFAVQPGDLVYLPSGTVHAIGAGILLAEVQQSSDTTYRVFDWHRVGLDGRPRELHVKEALESISFGAVGVPAFDAPPSGRPGIACKDFEIEVLNLSDGETGVLEGVGPLITMGVAGTGTAALSAGGYRSSLGCGETRLIPAAIAAKTRFQAQGRVSLLAVRIPA